MTDSSALVAAEPGWMIAEPDWDDRGGEHRLGGVSFAPIVAWTLRRDIAGVPVAWPVSPLAVSDVLHPLVLNRSWRQLYGVGTGIIRRARDDKSLPALIEDTLKILRAYNA